jgi:hypothetical protein
MKRQIYTLIYLVISLSLLFDVSCNNEVKEVQSATTSFYPEAAAKDFVTSSLHVPESKSPLQLDTL